MIAKKSWLGIAVFIALAAASSDGGNAWAAGAHEGTIDPSGGARHQMGVEEALQTYYATYPKPLSTLQMSSLVQKIQAAKAANPQFKTAWTNYLHGKNAWMAFLNHDDGGKASQQFYGSEYDLEHLAWETPSLGFTASDIATMIGSQQAKLDPSEYVRQGRIVQGELARFLASQPPPRPVPPKPPRSLGQRMHDSILSFRDMARDSRVGGAVLSIGDAGAELLMINKLPTWKPTGIFISTH